MAEYVETLFNLLGGDGTSVNPRVASRVIRNILNAHDDFDRDWIADNRPAPIIKWLETVLNGGKLSSLEHAMGVTLHSQLIMKGYLEQPMSPLLQTTLLNLYDALFPVSN